MLLLEVLLGIAILSMSGVALITLLTQTVHTVRHGRDTERRIMSASKLLNRATLWSTTELDVHVGRQRIDTWNLDVQMTQPDLYSLTVLDTLTGAAILQTMVYRPPAQANGT